MAKKRLGELLVETGLVSEKDLNRILSEQKFRKGKLGEFIVSQGLATEQEIAQALSLQLGIQMVDLQTTPIDPAAIEVIPEKVARKHLIMPMQLIHKELHLAMADPLSFEALEDVRFASGFAIKAFIATRSDILWAVDQHYHMGASIDTIFKDIQDERSVEVIQDRGRTDGTDVEDLVKKSEAAPIIRMVNALIAEAIDTGASDIHVEPAKHNLVIRNRVDGMLRKSQELPKWVQGAIISRLKIMAKLDIAEKRLPQDGRISVKIGAKSLDLRVSTIPANYGEKVVIRILDSSAAQLPMEQLGFGEEELRLLTNIVRAPQGVLLVTGPTGSGKSTTLYGLLNRVRTVTRNITTVEDPVEYELDGLTQVAVQDKIGLTFASMLRAMLRQDPDVIMVGEMRDVETANIAIQAALTGHLVLSTIHTNSTAATVTRLRNLGIPSYLIASSIIGILAQRLVRTICQKCKAETPPTEAERLRWGSALPHDAVLYHGTGCPNCGGTGYKGRMGLYEIMPFSPQLRDMITANAPEGDIRHNAVAHGMKTLSRAGMTKVQAGLTTLEELGRVLDNDDEFSSFCPSCQSPVGSDFLLCPVCGTTVVSSCHACKKMLSPEWNFCPFCREPVRDKVPERQPVAAPV
jgi:type IV pilus assembly protein PilB